MSQTLGKEVSFSCQQHFQLLQCLMPHIKLREFELFFATELTQTW